MPSFYGAIDLQKNELRQPQVHNLPSAPANPVTGQLYFNTGDLTLYFCSVGGGSPTWVAAKAAAGTAAATTVTTQAIGDAPVVGALTAFAREDHKHGMPAFAAPTAETTYGTSSGAGVATTLARSDHTHGNPSLTSAAPSTQAIGDAAAVGSGTLPAREDHKHAMPAFGVISAETSAFGLSKSDGVAATIARSDHTHGNLVHDAAAHSLIKITDLAVPTTSVNLGSQKIINLQDPTNAQDASTKNYVDNLVSGLAWKDAARAATTVAGGNITLSGTQTVDGVALVAGDRVLVKNQTTGSQNGLYAVAAGAWSRTTDADATGELDALAVYVNEGTVNADTAWVCTTNAPISVGGTALVFAQFGGGASYTAGTGITIAGNVIGFDDAVLATDAQVTSAIATHAAAPDPHTGYQLRTEKAAVNGYASLDATTKVPIAQVPTGASGTTVSLGNHTHSYAATTTTIGTAAGSGLQGGGDLSANRALSLDFATALATNTTLTRKYAVGLAGSASPETITHNLNTRDVQVTVLNGATPYTAVEVDWDAATVNTITVRYNPSLGAGYRCVVVG